MHYSHYRLEVQHSWDHAESQRENVPCNSLFGQVVHFRVCPGYKNIVSEDTRTHTKTDGTYEFLGEITVLMNTVLVFNVAINTMVARGLFRQRLVSGRILHSNIFAT